MSKRRFGLRLNLCPHCKRYLMTCGDQASGGHRWCRDCLPLSPGWGDLNPETQASMLARFDAPISGKLIVLDDHRKAVSA